MTVKELKKLLEDVDDELELVGYQNGMEQYGLLPISKYVMKTLQGGKGRASYMGQVRRHRLHV